MFIVREHEIIDMDELKNFLVIGELKERNGVTLLAVCGSVDTEKESEALIKDARETDIGNDENWKYSIYRKVK